jgi:hypothetical protein
MEPKRIHTIGKIATELAAQDTHAQSPIELEREMHKEYEENIHQCIERGKQEHPGDFFLVVLTKKERLLPNVLRHYYLHRATCPTPDYDQTVYRYFRQHDAHEFLWVVPDKYTCEGLRDNALHVNELERDLLRFVLDFYDDTLMKLSKKLNGEFLETPLLTAY